MPKPTARKLARKNLARVVKAVGGEFTRSDFFNAVEFYVGKYRFVVDPYGIFAWRSGRSLGDTCFSIKVKLPSDERIASAVLALHNNPRLFLYWRDHWHGEPRI